MVFTLSRDVGQKTAVSVGSINTDVTANLLDEHGIQTTGHLLDLS